MGLTKEQRAVLEHTAFRAAQGLYCGSDSTVQSLVEAGFMVSVGKKSFAPDEYFKLTRKGIAEANKPRQETTKQ